MSGTPIEDIMKRFLVATALALTWLTGCTPVNVSAPEQNVAVPEEYGSLAFSNQSAPSTQATEGYTFDHYELTVTGSHIKTPLKANIEPGKLVDGTAVAFEKVPVGDVVVYGEVIALDLQTVLASISIPVTVVANKTTTVFMSAPPAPVPPNRP
jgi:hypothetical protein